MEMTPSALRELCEKATPGPWACDPGEHNGCVVWSDGEAGQTIAHTHYDNTTSMLHQQRADAAFIAMARTELPRLLDENEALRAEGDRMARLLAARPSLAMVVEHDDLLRERDTLRARVEELERENQALRAGDIDRDEYLRVERDDGHRSRAYAIRRTLQEERDTALARAEAAEAKVASYERTLSEALNSGDGSYRP